MNLNLDNLLEYKFTIVSIFFSKVSILSYPENTLFIKYPAHISLGHVTFHSKSPFSYKNEEHVKYKGGFEHIQYIHLILFPFTKTRVITSFCSTFYFVRSRLNIEQIQYLLFFFFFFERKLYFNQKLFHSNLYYDICRRNSCKK